jgi:hypothetical protein
MIPENVLKAKRLYRRAVSQELHLINLDNSVAIESTLDITVLDMNEVHFFK